MFEGLEESQIAGAVEAMLFVTDEPVGVITLAEMLEVEPARVEAALVAMRARLEAEERGIQLREVAGGWRLYTHPAYHKLVEKYVLSWDTRKLSQAAMETLAIVAYLQPVTRAGVAGVRGVNSDSPINSLVEKGLVREAGQADAPGNPTLYATTRAFLEKFGLRSVKDLPDVVEFAPDEATRALIRERLSAPRDAVREADEALAEEREGEGAEDVFGEMSFDFDDEGAGAIAGGAGAMIGGEGRDGAASRPEAAGHAGAQGRAEAPNRAEMAARLDAQGRPERLAAMRDAMAASLGVVDKINFDELRFEDDDE